MRKYRDKNGGLEIEKSDPIITPVQESRKSRSFDMPHNVPAAMMLDTMVSYQQGQFTNNPSENGGSECVFCGTHTSYDNRHVCADCWKKYKNEIADGIREAVSDVEVHIE